MTNKLTTSNAKVELKQLDTRIIKIRGFTEYETIEYIDLLVDGMSLKDLICQDDPEAPDLTTCFQKEFYMNVKKEYIDQLTHKAKANLASGRVSLYVCPLDGDPSCLSVGCRIEYTEDYVRWYDFAWDNYEIEDLPSQEDYLSIEKIVSIDSFTFDRKEYETLFSGITDELRNLKQL